MGKVTQNNFERTVEMLSIGNKAAWNYNSECFGMSDIKLAMHIDWVMGQFIDQVIEKGYCPYATMNHVMQKHELYIKEDSKRPELKQAIESDFEIDYEIGALALAYSEAHYADYQKEKMEC